MITFSKFPFHCRPPRPSVDCFPLNTANLAFSDHTPQTPLAGPKTPLAGLQTPLADPQIPLAGPQTPQTPQVGPQNPPAGPQSLWMDKWMDRRTEFLPILQDFVPSRGRCPATLCNFKTAKKQGKGTADHMMPLGNWFVLKKLHNYINLFALLYHKQSQGKFQFFCFCPKRLLII